MSVMFPKYFGVPHAVIRSGAWAEMKPGEQSLYIALLHESERCRTRELQRTDAEVCKLAGVRPRTLCDARKRLQERLLVLCDRGLGNVYKYTLCDPETGCPWPGNPKEIVRYRRKGQASPEPQQSIAPDNEPVRQTDGATRPLESYGADVWAHD